MPRDLENELNACDGDYPAAWHPEAGAVLIGRIIRYGEGPGKYGPVRTAIIERDDGSRASLWIGSTVLLEEFRKARPKVGERIGVKALGRHPEKQYWRFRLLVDRPLSEGDFSPLGGEQSEAPSPASPAPAPRPAPRTTDRSPTPYASATVRTPGRSYTPPAPGDDDDPFVGF